MEVERLEVDVQDGELIAPFVEELLPILRWCMVHVILNSAIWMYGHCQWWGARTG